MAKGKYLDVLVYTHDSIGGSIRKRRLSMGLSQSELSKRSGIRIELISKIENGRGNPTISTIEKISRALGE